MKSKFLSNSSLNIQYTLFYTLTLESPLHNAVIAILFILVIAHSSYKDYTAVYFKQLKGAVASIITKFILVDKYVYQLYLYT